MKKNRLKNRNYHHLTNKCKGGKATKGNLLLINIERHRAWHTLFRNLDLEQVIELLKRVKRLKENL